MSEVRVVLCTFPSNDVARQIGTLLVEKQLVACVNLIPGVESIYRWQGALESAQEVLAILKTSASALTALEKELSALHPYEIPEFVAIDPTQVSAPYALWLEQSVNEPLQ